MVIYIEDQKLRLAILIKKIFFVILQEYTYDNNMLLRKDYCLKSKQMLMPNIGLIRICIKGLASMGSTLTHFF